MEVRYPPSKGVSQRYLREPLKNKAKGCDTIPPSAILSRTGIARSGGVSRTGPLSPEPDQDEIGTRYEFA